MSSIDSYLTSVHYRLAGLPDDEQEEIMNEIQAHLEDKAASLRAQGAADAEAAAGADFGDPAQIGSHLSDIHTRPTRRQTLLAVAPFAVIGVLPLVLMAVAAVDQALGPATGQTLRLFGLRLSHPGTQLALAFILLGMLGMFAYGGLWALGHGAPLWTAAWLGSLLLDAVAVLQILMDDAAEVALVVFMGALLVAAMATLVVVARRRGPLAALLIGLSLIIQLGIVAAYTLSAPPLGESTAALLVGVGLAIVGAITIAGALQRRAGYQAAIVLAIILSMAPYAIRLALTADAGAAAAGALLNLAIPFVMLLLVPYWLGRRQAASR